MLEKNLICVFDKEDKVIIFILQGKFADFLLCNKMYNRVLLTCAAKYRTVSEPKLSLRISEMQII